MKKALGLCMMTLFVLTGCTQGQPVDTETAALFNNVMREAYTFIESMQVYQKQGLGTLVVEYKSSEIVEGTEVAKCFEDTRRWLLDEGHLLVLEDEAGQQFGTLVITINTKTYKHTYTSVGERQETVEDNIIRFDKWQQETVEKVAE